MKKQILIECGIRYSEVGTRNFVVLILPGGGDSYVAYFPLQDGLVAKNQDLRVLMIDLLGIIDDSPTIISPEEWGILLNEFIDQVIGKDKFVLVAHSLGTMVGAQYLKYANKNDRCEKVIFFNQGLANNYIEYLIMYAIFGTLRLVRALPTGMKWMENKVSFDTARALMNDGYEKIQLTTPCVVILGRKDLLRCFLAGHKRLTPVEFLPKDWDHAPNKKNMPELIRVLEELIRKIAPSS